MGLTELVYRVLVFHLDTGKTRTYRVRLTPEAAAQLKERLSQMQEDGVVGYFEVEQVTLEIEAVSLLDDYLASIETPDKKPRGRLAAHVQGDA